MSEQFIHGLRLLLVAPVPALATHGAMLWHVRRRAARGAPRRLPPLQRVWALYAAGFAAAALLAALDATLFSARLLFGSIFFCSALAALRWEHKARERQKTPEAGP